MVQLFRHWWNHPVQYGWTVNYYLSHSALRWTRYAIGVWCWLFSAVAVFALFTPAGPTGTLPQLIVAVLIGSAVVVGAAWMAGSWPGRRVSLIFVVYADVGVATVFVVMSDELSTFPGIALLAVIGSYIATFHDAKAFVAHQLFGIAATAVLFVGVVRGPDTDTALALMYLTIVVLIQFSVPVLTQGLLLLLRQDATSAYFDPLTGLLNRRGLGVEIASTIAGENPLSAMTVAVIDVDDFKAVNDRFGHSRGDAVLTEAAAQMKAIFGPSALLGRSGGEEFVVVTREELADTLTRARRYCAAILASAGVSVSVGLATHSYSRDNTGPHSAGVVETLMQQADQAMYEAKRGGGHTVRVADSCR